MSITYDMSSPREPLPRGVYCQHGKRIMVPESEEEYSAFKFAKPWPCGEESCTPEIVEEEMQREAEEYEVERWEEYYRITHGG